MDETGQRVAALRSLATYWGARPQAADTIEGILSWWLPDDRLPSAVVQQALDWLTREGTVVAIPAADGRVRFRLAKPTPDTLRSLIEMSRTDGGYRPPT